MPGRWMDERERYLRDQDEIDRQARRYAERPSWDEDADNYRRRDIPGGAQAGERTYDPRTWRQPQPRFSGEDYTRRPSWEGRSPDDRYSRPYDHDSGYIARRPDEPPGRFDDERFEDRARDAGRGLRRMGERVAGWLDGLGDRLEGDEPVRRYRTDFGREPRWAVGDHRGRGPKDYRRSDDSISDEVQARLTDDPWIDASQIQVAVSAGEVTLSGGVENRQARRRAEDIVQDISGVTHVQNDLRVGGGSFFTSAGSGFGDSVLEAQIRQGGPSGGHTPGADSAMSRTTTRRS